MQQFTYRTPPLEVVQVINFKYTTMVMMGISMREEAQQIYTCTQQTPNVLAFLVQGHFLFLET